MDRGKRKMLKSDKDTKAVVASNTFSGLTNTKVVNVTNAT